MCQIVSLLLCVSIEYCICFLLKHHHSANGYPFHASNDAILILLLSFNVCIVIGHWFGQVDLYGTCSHYYFKSGNIPIT